MATVSGTMAHPLDLLSSLSQSSQSFLQPGSSLHLDALAYVKTLLDPLAADIADVQKLRRNESKRKRKRGDGESEEEILHLRQVYTNGLGVKQVWEQARRVLDAACAEVERDIAIHKDQAQPSSVLFNGTDNHGTDDDNTPDDLEDEGISEKEGDDSEDDALDDELLDEGSDDDLEEDIEEDIEDEAEDSEADPAEDDPGTFVPDPNNLNDGFFSIDDFNRQTQFLEQQDARGEDDNPSDEDEIDWNADPLTMSYHKPKASANGEGRSKDEISDAEDDDDDEAGPTFGNADLNADDSDDDLVDGESANLEDGVPPGLDNTNEIRYADFFAPPPKRQSKTKRMRALPKTQPAVRPRAQDDDEMEIDMERAISNVHRDLLESDEESNPELDSDLDDDGLSMKHMSSHEKQRAAIAAEIRRLEAASVAKRDWTLSGEARGVDRPLNSLIEEDLEFERVGKPVPVVTAEDSEAIEQLIKRRILAREFDEIVRRRADAIGTANDTRRGRVEVDDTKPQSGLAEVYEEEHLRATDPGYVDKRSAATKKQHAEISKLWKEVSSQLDLLSNLYFKPKRAEAEIKVVEDKPTISMEDARPVGMGVNAEDSMLAPQEIYRPGEEKRSGEGTRDLVVRKSGASVNKDEMTREEKLRRRRREKERTKKSRAQGKAITSAAASDSAVGAGGRGKKSKDQEKADILSDLRKGNVRVIGKKGELQEIEGTKGKKRKGDLAWTSAQGGAGGLKL